MPKLVSHNHARFCDSTCSFCAREFWNWLKSRNAQMSMSLNGGTSFADAAARSVKPGYMATQASTAPDPHTPE